MNNPAALAETKLKHAAGIRYLDKMIKNSSLNKEEYKVAYYLKADTKMAQNNQLQTVYLGQTLKKIEAIYSHVKLILKNKYPSL